MSNTWTWIGGGNNEWNNPADWQPSGVPRPGDTLIMQGGTINISHAFENFQITASPSGAASDNQINLNGGDILNIDQTGISSLSINVNARGAIVGGALFGVLEQDKINLAPHTSMIFTGTYDDEGFAFGGPLEITGRGTFINEGTITATRAEINSSVLGLGTIRFTATHDEGPGNAEVSGASGRGLTYDLGFNSITTVEHPHTFMSKVEMDDGSFLTLAGLAATSYDFKNDLLTLYQGNTPVYRLRVTDQSSDGQPLYVTSSTGGVSVGVLPPPSSGLVGTTLTQHTAGA
jgi:hypothetical protein